MTCCGNGGESARNPFRHDDHWAEYETRMISALAAGAAGFAAATESSKRRSSGAASTEDDEGPFIKDVRTKGGKGLAQKQTY